MSRLDDQHDHLGLDGFEELLADEPRDGKGELVGGRVAEMTTGARWEHDCLIQNIAGGVVGVVDRAGDARFTRRLIGGLDAALDLGALDLSIPTAEIHRDVLESRRRRILELA